MSNSYLRRVGTAFSIFLNVITGGAEYQTLSARQYGRKRRNKINLVKQINWIFRDSNHCLTSWVYWRVRKDTIQYIKYQSKLTDEKLKKMIIQLNIGN